MVASPSRHSFGVAGCLVIAALATGPATCAPASRVFSLQQVNERDPAKGFSPIHVGERVTIQGVVNSRAYHLNGFQLLALQDSSHGVLLRIPTNDTRTGSFHPGDELRVGGVVVFQDGVAMVEPQEFALVGTQSPPTPEDVTPRELAGFRYLGRLIRTEGKVTAGGDTPTGSYIKLDLPLSLTVFLPHSAQYARLISGLDIDTPVRVTGVAFQFCTAPAYDRGFQVLVNETKAVATMDRGWTFRPSLVAATVGGIFLAVLMLWQRDRRSIGQRERLRKTYQLGEEILSASSTQMILERLSEAVPEILGVTNVQLYVYNRGAKALYTVPRGNEESVSISLSAPPGGPRSGAVACFHYRTLLSIPDVDRSPFPIGKAEGPSPKSLLLFP